MSIRLREPWDQLIKDPLLHTRGKGFLPPGQIKIYDDTLREGEQMAGVAFSPIQKLKLARMLSRLGVDVLQVAFPAVGESEMRALELILAARKRGQIRWDVEIQAMSRARRDDIAAVAEAAERAGVPTRAVSLLILSAGSDLHMKYKLGRTLLKTQGLPAREWLGRPVSFYREANIRAAVAAIRCARAMGFAYIEFAAEDASRAELSYLLDWAGACIDAGGTRLSFCDTVGCLTPEAVDFYIPPLVRMTRARGIDLHVHCHNDLGLASANCVRALSHGATHAGVTLCGIGDRVGIAALEQVVMQLRLLYGITLPRLQTRLLAPARHLLEEVLGFSMPAHQPIVGDGAFAHESGIHTAGLSVHPSTYEFIPKKMLGARRRLVFGKHSGSQAVTEVLSRHKRDLGRTGADDTRQLSETLRDWAKRERETRRREISESEILKMAARFQQDKP